MIALCTVFIPGKKLAPSLVAAWIGVSLLCIDIFKGSHCVKSMPDLTAHTYISFLTQVTRMIWHSSCSIFGCTRIAHT